MWVELLHVCWEFKLKYLITIYCNRCYWLVLVKYSMSLACFGEIFTVIGLFWWNIRSIWSCESIFDWVIFRKYHKNADIWVYFHHNADGEYYAKTSCFCQQMWTKCTYSGIGALYRSLFVWSANPAFPAWMQDYPVIPLFSGQLLSYRHQVEFFW